MQLQKNPNNVDKLITGNDVRQFTKMAAMRRVEGVELDDKERQYLLPHFLMLLVGKPGSGKTTLIKHLVMDKQFYRNKFDETLIVSPSHSKIGLPIKSDQATSEFSLKWIYENLDKVNNRQQRVLERLVVKKAKVSVDTLEQFGDGEIQRAVTIDRAGLDGLNHMGLQLATNSRDISMHAGLSQRGNDDYLQYKMRQGGLMHSIPLSRTKYGQSLRGETLLYNQYVQVQNKHGYNPNELRKRTSKQMVKKSMINQVTNIKNIPKGGYKEQPRNDFYQDFISRVANLDKKILSMLTPEEIEQSRCNVLIILDDVVSAIKGMEYDMNLAQLFFNRRHLVANGTVSIIIVTQKYTMIPSRIRSNASWVIMYRLNPLDFENVFNDVYTGSLKQWKELLKFVFGNEDDNLMQLSLQRKGKNFDNLGIWVESDTYFSNFQQIVFKKGAITPEENQIKNQPKQSVRQQRKVSLEDRQPQQPQQPPPQR